MTLAYDTPAELITYLSAKQYAASIGASLRTVMRYLDDGELPGARKIDGAWAIVAGTPRPLPSARSRAEVVAMPAPVTPVTYDTAPASYVMAYDTLPTLLPLDIAAAALEVSVYALRKHRDVFGLLAVGPHGSLRMPLATLRRLRGE